MQCQGSACAVVITEHDGREDFARIAWHDDGATTAVSDRLSSSSYLGQYGVTQVSNRRQRYSCGSKIEWYIEGSGCNPGVPSGFSAAARLTRAYLQWVLRGRDKGRVTGPKRPCDRAKGMLERNEEGAGRAAGWARSFIQFESGGRPVHAPCPTQRSLNPGGQTATLR